MSTLTRISSSATPADPRTSPSSRPKPPSTPYLHSGPGDRSSARSGLQGMQSSAPATSDATGPASPFSDAYSPYAGVGHSLGPAAASTSTSGTTTIAAPLVAGHSRGDAHLAAMTGARSDVPVPHPSGVLDLTSSSPPSSARRRALPAAALAAGIVLPGAYDIPSNVGASTSGVRGSPAAASTNLQGHRSHSSRGTSTAAAHPVTLSSGSESSDADDLDYVPSPGRSGAPGSGASASTSATLLVGDSDDDSEVEILSMGPVRPPPARLPGFNDVLGSPPPYVVPPGATRVRRSARMRSGRAGTATPGVAGGHTFTPDDSGMAAARAIAQDNQRLAGQVFGVPGGPPSNGAIPLDYIQAQQAAYREAQAASQRRAALRDYAVGDADNGGEGGGGSGWGIFSRTGGLGGTVGAQALLDNLRFLTGLTTEGGFWPGQFGGGGGGYGYGYGAGPAGGWGGAAKVRASKKKYTLKLSHPDKLEPGFARDIVEPPPPADPDAGADLDTIPSPPAKKARRAGGKPRARAPPVALEPVCASCLETLLLGGEGAHKVFALRCGHAVCLRCLDEARARCRAIAEAERGGSSKRSVQHVRKGAVGAGAAAAASAAVDPDRGRGPATSAVAVVGATADDNDEVPADSGGSSSRAKGKGKGKARSRADETGVEEDWTTCPVAGCDGRGTDLLATEGWTRPYELFA